MSFTSTVNTTNTIASNKRKNKTEKAVRQDRQVRIFVVFPNNHGNAGRCRVLLDKKGQLLWTFGVNTSGHYGCYRGHLWTIFGWNLVDIFWVNFRGHWGEFSWTLFDIAANLPAITLGDHLISPLCRTSITKPISENSMHKSWVLQWVFYIFKNGEK